MFFVVSQALLSFFTGRNVAVVGFSAIFFASFFPAQFRPKHSFCSSLSTPSKDKSDTTSISPSLSVSGNKLFNLDLFSLIKSLEINLNSFFIFDSYGLFLNSIANKVVKIHAY